ncbi:MAG: sigma-54-dependent Fis family transcriptional regulator [Gemmatimonadetes bacterium]|nr:sigma-54-dependent Fis family transcriptional regulator [Gemmatimonadota bacterium]
MKVLVIDDDSGLRRTVSLLLEDEGHTAETAADGDAGLQKSIEWDPDLILTDVRMPGMDGLELLDRLREAGSAALVIVMTAYGSQDQAVEAIRKGAWDYIDKPFAPDALVLRVKIAEESTKKDREIRRLRREVKVEKRHGGIIASSAGMRDAVALAERVAPHPTTVLVTGESGTGKELIARLIHEVSGVAGNFVPINCGAIPENLLESELFGHVRGSFTGANSDRTGLFEEADNGTLFLDEIGELPQSLQVKLLRALQSGEIRRVGDSKPRQVNVRIVAATARDLESEVQTGEFRSDLYYRINVVRIHLPPLRHRREEVPLLARHFIEAYNEALGMEIEGLQPEALKRMQGYSWPGNVREVENVVERAMVIATGSSIELDDLPEIVRDPESMVRISSDTLSSDELSVKKRSAELEKHLISRALEVTEGNRTRAAELLDLSYRALLYKIRDYGLD